MKEESWIDTPKGKVLIAKSYVNRKLSEDIPLDENNPEHSKIIEEKKELGVYHKGSVIGVLIDYSNEKKLNEVFNREYDKWAKGKKANSEQLFAEWEIKTAKEHLKYLPEYMHDNEQNYYYAFITAWIEYCTKRKESREGEEQKAGKDKRIKIPAKFYALYHWLRIEMGAEKPFEKNDNGQFIRTEIEAYSKEKYPDCSAQRFYRSFKDLDITNRTAIAKSFGDGYKEKLIIISGNDNKLITHLKSYPN